MEVQFPEMGAPLNEIDSFTSDLTDKVNKSTAKKSSEMPIFEGTPVPVYGSGKWEIPSISTNFDETTFFAFRYRDEYNLSYTYDPYIQRWRHTTDPTKPLMTHEELSEFRMNTFKYSQLFSTSSPKEASKRRLCGCLLKMG